MEQAYKDCVNLEACQSGAKEAMYALDVTNPLSFFDCLIPELEAYRPKRIDPDKTKMTFDYSQRLILAEKELYLVSRCILTMALYRSNKL